MIVLDTNVLSALMQRAPDARVVDWLDTVSAGSVWTTTITLFEIRFGIELLAHGRRRRRLEQAFAQAIREDFDGRVLPFDEAAAEAAASLAAARRTAGRPVDIRDLQIAGIVSAHKASLATRNPRHFTEMGFDLFDPWSSPLAPG